MAGLARHSLIDEEIKSYNGVTGSISYTRASRAPAKPVAVIGVQQGLFKPLWSWPPKEGKE